MVLGYMVLGYGTGVWYWDTVLGYVTEIWYWDMVLG